jgi:hypothetical protein
MPTQLLTETYGPGLPVIAAQTKQKCIVGILEGWRDRDGWIVKRPGMVGMYIGGTAPGNCQAVGNTDFSVGTPNTWAVFSGELYTFNWTTAVWTRVVTTANLTTASITLQGGANSPVYWVNFAGGVVFNDESNRPFFWDGRTGSVGLTSLTNGPASALRQPVVYAAKLFFIKGAAGEVTIVWSEENQPNTGYEAGGFNNAWDLIQTSRSPIQQLAATNYGLFVFRTDQTEIIRGRVTTTFQTDATLAAIPGTGLAGRAPVFANNRLWWVSQWGRPTMLPIGSTDPIDISVQFEWAFSNEAALSRQGLPGLSAADYSKVLRTPNTYAEAIYFNDLDKVGFLFHSAGSLRRDTLLYDVEGRAAGRITDHLATASWGPAPHGVVYDYTNAPSDKRVALVGGDDFPYMIYASGLDADQEFDGSNKSAPELEVVLSKAFEGSEFEMMFDIMRVRIETDGLAGAQTFNLGLYTPADLKAGTLSHDGITETLTDGTSWTEHLLEYGVGKYGRWAYPSLKGFTFTTVGKYRILDVTIEAYPVAPFPKVD